MKFVYGFISMLGSLVAAEMSFEKQLKHNIETYKYSNFRWNTLNLDQNNFISLRKLEESKDSEFSEYLQLLYKTRKDRISQQKLYRDRQSSRLMHYKRSAALSPQVMMYNDQLMTEMAKPLSMMYMDQKLPQPMMYNAREERSPRAMRYDERQSLDLSPQVMMYNDQLMTEMAKPLSMMYMDQKLPQPMMYNAREERSPRAMRYDERQSLALSPQVMMYNDQLMTEMAKPLSMMYMDQKLPQPMMYNAREERSPRAMRYDERQSLALSPQVMMYNAQLMTEMAKPLSMMYFDPKLPQPMMYNAREERSPRAMRYDERHSLALGPQVMMYNAQLMTEMTKPLSMMYFDPKLPQPMMYNAREERSPRAMRYDERQSLALSPQVMMYNAQLMTEMAKPLSMMYFDPKLPQPMMYNAREERSPRAMRYDERQSLALSPQVMMYNAQQMTEMAKPLSMMYFDPKLPQPMMYNAREERSPRAMRYDERRFLALSPQVMMYNAQLMTEMAKPLSMMYFDPKLPQPMMYNAREERSPRAMRYDERQSLALSPQVMMYNAQLMTEMAKPLSMMYFDPKLPQPMMYNAREERSPRAMRYDERQSLALSPQVMMYNAQLMTEMAKPLSMMYFDPKLPQPMMYNAREERSPRAMRYDDQLMAEMVEPQSMLFVPVEPPEESKYMTDVLVSQQFGKRRNEPATQSSKIIDTVILNKTEWFKMANALVKTVPESVNGFFRHWKHTISIFGKKKLLREQFLLDFPGLNKKTLVQEIAKSNVFEKLFWPFVYRNAFMNQKLGLLGFSGLSVTPEKQKTVFYEVLEKYQTIKTPFKPDRIVYSFNDSDLVEGLSRSGLMETNKEYVDAGLHLYTPEEQTAILYKVDAAMALINKTMPELYKSIHQVIGCIAFYKAQRAGFAGGTVSSALGVIWQDPRAYREQSVAHYAEQIVHEYIHSSLFLADLVHGTFADFHLISRAKVYSPIRHELRDFDKVFHASYVSTGVALFHARAGNWDKAQKLLEPLRTSVDGLVKINKELGVLNDSGNAMLQVMDDFLTLIRLL